MITTGKWIRRAVVVAAAVAFGSGVHAESGVGFSGSPGVRNPLKPGTDGLKGLFAAEKFDMHHTVGVSFGTGANRFSQYYLNDMTYKVSEPLTIHATLGIQNRSLGGSALDAGADGARVIVPNIGVLYQPTEKLTISFQFSNAPYYGGFGPYGSYRGY